MRIRDINHIVARLMQEEWSRFDHEIISAAITEVSSSDGGHFEHFL